MGDPDVEVSTSTVRPNVELTTIADLAPTLDGLTREEIRSRSGGWAEAAITVRMITEDANAGAIICEVSEQVWRLYPWLSLEVMVGV